MGLQLSMNESSNIISRAIKATGENLNRDFYHVHSAPGHQGFSVEIADQTLEAKLSKISNDYDNGDFVFTLNIPYEYFNDDQLPEDNNLGIEPIDHTEVKAEIRCMGLITKTYENWIKDHEVCTTQDLLKIINKALDKLRQIKKLDLYAHGNKNEVAEKYINIYFTEGHIPPTGGSEKERFFQVLIQLADYYDDVGNNVADHFIGENNLRGRPRREICLLRVAYITYKLCIGWFRTTWPEVYKKYKNGEF